jgi:sigma-B regulation protein RsbU (phosphoserine phosphatase)
LPLKNAEGRIIGTFGITRDITKHKEAELRARQAAEEMRLIAEEMEEDIRMAGDLQKTFFPSTYPAFPHGVEPEASCVEFLHAVKGCSDVGSDYCTIRRVSENEAGIFICDVGGIGVRSALGTALVRGIVQEISPLKLDPGAYLSRMNELLVPLMCQEGEDDTLLQISACYLLLDTFSGKIRYASAGHPPPILFRQNGDTGWLCADRQFGGPPFPEKTGFQYAAYETRVDRGDAVVLYTDGLYSTRNRLDEPYGLKRLLDSARSLTGDPLAEIFSRLEGDALAFSKTSVFSDDVCLVGFLLRKPPH